MRERLLAHVRSNPGQRADQIAQALGTDVGTMRLPMRALVDDKKVSTKGQRRGTTYHAGAAGPGGKSRKPSAKAGKKKRKGRRRRTAR